MARSAGPTVGSLKMDRTMKQLIIIALLTLTASAAKAQQVAGFRTLEFTAAHQQAPVRGGVWYPASTDGKLTRFAENAVFTGVPVRRDASIAVGRYPVVLLSHGLGGHIRSLAWLGAGLAERGAIVVAVNHPASTYTDFDLQRGLNHWTRVADLQAALAHVEQHDDYQRFVDGSRLYAAGFSYGGWTALSMGGLTGNLAGYAAHCAKVVAASSHCNDLIEGGADLDALDAELWNASYKVPQLTAVAAIDPALLYGLTQSNLAGLLGKVQLIALGAGANRLLATDYSDQGSGFQRFLPDTSMQTIKPASHYTALPVCKPEGPAILLEEGDDPVCTDPAGTDRAAVHQRIVEVIARTFSLE